MRYLFDMDQNVILDQFLESGRKHTIYRCIDIRCVDVQGKVILFADYLCAPEANVYEIDFTRFKIRDLDSGAVLFEIAKPTVGKHLKTCFAQAQLTYSVGNVQYDSQADFSSILNESDRKPVSL